MKLKLSNTILILILTISVYSFFCTTNAQSYKIAFFASPDRNTPNGYSYDKPLMDTLRGLGYTVDHMYTTDECVSEGKLNTYNLIVIGRGSRSGDFADTPFWESIKAPILCLSGYMVFPNFLNLIGTGQLQGPNGDRFNVDHTIVQYANVIAPDDTSFYNITLDDGKMPYNTWIYDFINYDSASFVAENNGKLLATYTGLEPSLGNNRVTMARWSPGIKTYENGVTPQGYRTYMQMGTDNDGNPVILNHIQFTPESYQVFKNEIHYLISLYEDSVSTTDKPACSDASIRRIIFSDEEVINPYPSGSKTISTNIESAELKDAEPVIQLTDADASLSDMYYDTTNHYLVVETVAGDGTTTLEYNFLPSDYSDLITSLQTASSNDFSVIVYPNPVTDYLNVEMSQSGSKEIKIYNNTLQLMARYSTKSNRLQINTNHYKHGFYLVEIKHDQIYLLKPFLKK